MRPLLEVVADGLLLDSGLSARWIGGRRIGAPEMAGDVPRGGALRRVPETRTAALDTVALATEDRSASSLGPTSA